MNSISANARGAIYMMLSMACFGINDALMKSFTGQLEWYQALAIRGGIGVLVCIVLALALDGPRPVGDVVGYAGNWSCAGRILFELAGTAFFLLALFNLPLADATAILQLLPLLMMLGGVLVFGERIGWRRLTASAVGFVGVMLIVQPGSAAFSPAAFYALAAALAMAGRDLTTKMLPRRIPSTYVALLTTFFVWIMGIAISVNHPLPELSSWMLVKLTVAAVLIGFGFLFSVMTVRTGDVSFTAPFRYSILIWASLIGLIFFGEIPGLLKIAGAVLLVVAGIYSFSRDRAKSETTGPAR